MPDQAKQSSWKGVSKTLQLAIISGRYRPRERLIEDEIMASMGATRHAVRRAFDELERIGLVIRQPNKGVQVRDYSVSEIEELYEIRECLETRAASRLDKPADKNLILRLTEIASKHKDASLQKRFAEVFILNNEFHDTVYHAAGNQQLADAIRHYTFATHPIRTRAFPDERLLLRASDEHFSMIRAIATGNAAELQNIIKVHISRPKLYYIEATYAQQTL